jgi:hypothetical protein
LFGLAKPPPRDRFGLDNEKLNKCRDIAVTTYLSKVIEEAAVHSLGSRILDLVFPGWAVERSGSSGVWAGGASLTASGVSRF